MKPKITPEMKLGTREFENTMFMLNIAPREENINRFALQGNLIPERLDRLLGSYQYTFQLILTSSLFLLQISIIDGQLVAHKFILRIITKLQQWVRRFQLALAWMQ